VRVWIVWRADFTLLPDAEERWMKSMNDNMIQLKRRFGMNSWVFYIYNSQGSRHLYSRKVMFNRRKMAM
jgi:hypothetical protein